MSQSPTITRPPDGPPAPSHVPPPPRADAPFSVEGAAATIAHLRAELAQTSDPPRQARLLADLADLEEQVGDQPGAARDYLAAYNASSSFREPLEGLVRLLERRRSLKNLGKLIDALVRAAVTPDEQVRALVMRAWHEADVTGDVAEAKNSARAATGVEGASAVERATSWLLLEVLAGRVGDGATRQEALGERTKHAADGTWRALLLVDCARLSMSMGEIDTALAHLEQARSVESEATWAATLLVEEVLHAHPGEPGSDEASARARARAEALEALAGLVQDSVVDGARGDALGVPHWMRQPARAVDAWMRTADGWRVAGQEDRAAASLDRAFSVVSREAASSASGPAGQEDAWRLAEAVLTDARIRLAERAGDTALAAQLAEKRLQSETDPGLAAALAMRVAEHAASVGDGARALQAVSRAIAGDAGCLPARALQLDMLADGGDAGAFAAQLESFADFLATDEARGRAFLLAAYVWAVQAKDVAGAKAALSQAAMFGIPSGNRCAGRSSAGRNRRRCGLVRGGHQAAHRRRRSRGRDGVALRRALALAAAPGGRRSLGGRAPRDGRGTEDRVARARARSLPPAGPNLLGGGAHRRGFARRG